MSGGRNRPTAGGRADSLAASNWFIRLFGVAIVAHLAGNANPVFATEGLVALAAGLVGAVLIAMPSWRLATLAAGLVLATVFFEAPVVGNHWLVAGFLSLLLIGGFLRTLGSTGQPSAEQWWQTVAPGGRLLFLLFYGFSALAKLNSGFFHSEASCGLFYANQWLDSWRLPTMGTGAAAVLLAVLVATIELSVPILLLRPVTRRWGILLAYGFHIVIAFDLDQHFYDFTAIVLLLVTLFWTDADLAAAEQLSRRWPIMAWAVAVGAAGLSVASLASGQATVRSAMETGAFIWFAVVAVVVIGLALRLPSGPIDVRLRPAGIGSVAILALVALNGLSPYLELKTGTSFNMYSNLRTVDGDSNHLAIRRTLPLRDEQNDAVLIIATEIPGLELYVDSGQALTRTRLADYLSYSDRDASLTVQGTTSGVIETTTAGELADRLPLLRDKFLLFRAFSVDDTVPCQPRWLPAS